MQQTCQVNLHVSDNESIVVRQRAGHADVVGKYTITIVATELPRRAVIHLKFHDYYG
jgi:hypothetical protein